MATGEPMPTYSEVVRGIVDAHREFSDFEKYPIDFSVIYRDACGPSRWEAMLIIGLTAGISLARYLFTLNFYLPIARSCGLPNARKFCESAFKFKAYLILWSCSFWVMIYSGRYDFFQNPSRMMDYSDLANEVIPNDIRLLYFLQISFYLHCLYGTLYLDVWRKDSVTMLVHHVLTLCLLYFSFVMKYYKIGAMILCMHDVSDLFLEVTKLCVYLKEVPSSFRKTLDVLSGVGFASFAGTWALCRLYWFPLKLVHACNYGTLYYDANENYPKMWFILNPMCLTLQVLHIYWFCYILQLLFKILTGKTKGIHDTREFEPDSAGEDSTKRKLEAVKEEKEEELEGEPEGVTKAPCLSSIHPRDSKLRQRRPPPGARQNGHL